jgi:glucose/arabinose dehydrogenase
MDPNAFPRNSLYRLNSWTKLLLDLPIDDNVHNGGKIVIGPDKNVYMFLLEVPDVMEPI